MIKNSPHRTPKPTSHAKFLAMQNRENPSLDDVPLVLAALKEESRKPTGRTLHVKPGKSGLEFLSPNRKDDDQPASSLPASASGKDEPPAYEFFANMCTQINHDLGNKLEVRNAAAELFKHILFAQPMQKTHLRVDDTKAFRQKLIALDEARKAQQHEPRRKPTWDEKKQRRLASLEAFKVALPAEESKAQRQQKSLKAFRKPVPDNIVELEEHTPFPQDFQKNDTSSTRPPQGRRTLQNRRDRKAAPDSSVNVDQAMSQSRVDAALRPLAIHTVTRLAGKEQRTKDEELQLTTAEEYLKRTAPASDSWDPMTEVRLETDPPSGYFAPPKK